MTVRATVLIPTHEHGSLLREAAASALAQTVEALEVFIVLDGADPATEEAARAMAAQDSRVRVFRNDKGERHGETHRHSALMEASGTIVCYLSDDDLWFPDHVEHLERLLADHDFAHSRAVVVDPGDVVTVRHVGDVADPWYRRGMLDGHNFVPLSTAGHTLAAYEVPGRWWSPAPPTLPTDLHMWQKYVCDSSVRVVSGGTPTVVHFRSPARSRMTLNERVVELRAWHDRLRKPGGWDDLRARSGDQVARRLAAAERDLGAARHRLDVIESSTGYRGARRLARIPVLGRVSRWAGRALVRRGGR